MISQEARRVIARIRAEHEGPDIPLEENRRNWIARASALPLPAGTTITPQRIEGGLWAEWVDAPGASRGRVFLLLHGGGYNAGSPVTHRRLAAMIGIETGMRVLVPDYALAPEHPYPAGLVHALGAYAWLTGEGSRAAGEAGILPADVVVGGDSAGGGLTLSLLLSLRDGGLPLPRAAVLLSPWTDLTVSSPSYALNRDRDPSITQNGLREAGVMYAGGSDPADPMLSPLFADLGGLPPLLIHVGGDEAMLDDSRLLAERAAAAGVEVLYRLWPGLWHVHHHEAPEVPEAAQALREIGSYVRSRFGGPA